MFYIQSILYDNNIWRMAIDKYAINADKTLMAFEFVSEGPKGKIVKVVQYVEGNLKGFYNLGFGDRDSISGEINDLIVSNNGDSEKVLATVIETVYMFMKKYPDAIIYVTGSTQSRTRLYRMGIAKYLDEIREDFELYGQKDGEWLEFKNGVAYTKFLVYKKIRL